MGKRKLPAAWARLSSSPFTKVEASKFTEVGYVGRDVESMVRDLVEIAVDMVREEKLYEIQDKAEENAEERLLDLLLPPIRPVSTIGTENDAADGEPRPATDFKATREKLRSQLREGKLDHRSVELDVRERMFPSLEVISSSGVEEMDINLKDMLPGIFGGRTRKREMKVPEALEYLMQEEEQKLVDPEQVARLAVERTEQSGIIFVDEMDKVAGREGGHGPDVSREGVQRDLLPIVEGTSVATKYGMVRTDHILFVAAGAFHVSKPSDLIPELQGRFPIRVELSSLNHEDFVRILREPRKRALEAIPGAPGDGRARARVHRRCRRDDRVVLDDGKRAHREHRGAPTPYDHGKSSGRAPVRSPGATTEEVDHRRRLRQEDAGRYCERRRHLSLYSVAPSSVSSVYRRVAASAALPFLP